MNNKETLIIPFADAESDLRLCCSRMAQLGSVLPVPLKRGQNWKIKESPA